MSFRLKSATFAALALSALAAVTATDMSSASSAAAFPATAMSSTGTLPIESLKELKVPAASRPQVDGQKPVIFSAPREVAQPIQTLSPAPQAAVLTMGAATSLSALVDAHGDPEDVDGDMRCLAGAVYFESKGESLEGQLAVARVIINRARSGRFAQSLCGVVYQPGQFSFVRGHDMPAIRTGGQAWREAVAIAQIALNDSWDSRAEGALFFHARRVSPGWGKARLALIDNHVFYR
ncbi:MAG: cell wall hydrolase [Sphingobium sp.]|nr:cell wall hydrolase [Sphingobium sp.]